MKRDEPATERYLVAVSSNQTAPVPYADYMKLQNEFIDLLGQRNAWRHEAEVFEDALTRITDVVADTQLDQTTPIASVLHAKLRTILLTLP